MSVSRLTYIVTALFVALPSVAAGGQDISSKTAQSRLRGIARDTNGLPVANALILPFPHGGKPIKTNADGTFELLGPSEERPIDWILACHLGRDIAGVTELSDANGLSEVSLKRGITLKGRVSDPNGKPIKGAKLSPYVHLGDLEAGFGLTAWPTSEPNGSFEIKPLPVWPVDCSYGLRVSADGYGYSSASEVSCDSPGIKNLGEAILQPAVHSLEGMVFDENDKPVPNAEVSIGGEGQPYHRIRTDGEGRFQVRGVCAGQLEIFAKAAPGAFGLDEAEADANDVEIYIRPTSSCMLPPKSPPPSLIAKQLPDLTQLDLPSKAENTNEKNVLLCLVKLKESPSRQCIRQLAQDYDALRKKDVIVIAIQTWPFNESQIERWRKRNNVQFPIVILQDEITKAPEDRFIHLFGVQNRIP